MARTISIERERLRRWLDNFERRHPGVDAQLTNDQVAMTADDGATAGVTVPFPPLTGESVAPADSGAALLDRLVDHVGADRHVGALLVRKHGFAVGVFHGVDLIGSKVGGGYVQGKTKAGGWSQQRYARRRDHQARQLYDRAAAAADAVITPRLDGLHAIATGGDRNGVDAVVQSCGLSRARELILPRVFPVSDPRLRVLESFPEQFLALRIELNDRA